MSKESNVNNAAEIFAALYGRTFAFGIDFLAWLFYND
jgi:hypothetical protein